jgi:hypothetical protein
MPGWVQPVVIFALVVAAIALPHHTPRPATVLGMIGDPLAQLDATYSSVLSQLTISIANPLPIRWLRVE